MSRGGRTKRREISERRCIATGEVAPKAGLVRFVVGPGEAVVPDVAEKLPGRGMWVAADRAALDRAAQGRAFSRAARQQVAVPPDLAERVEAELAQRVVAGISLARKAGAAVAGFETVRGWLESGAAAVLIQAADGSPRGKSKLRPPDGEGAFIGCLSASEMGLAFGREHVIHAALAVGGLATRVAGDALRLSGVRRTDGAKPPLKGVEAR